MTGFTMEEVIGGNPRILKSGKQGDEFYAGMWSTISSGKVWHGEVTNRRKDGTTYTEEMTIAPVVSNHGQIAHYIAVKQDVSARKLAEAALERAEERYREIFDQAVVGIFQSTPAGEFLMMNPAMARMLRVGSPEEAVERIENIGLFYGDPTERQSLMTQLEANGTLQFERKFSCKDGTELWLSVNLRCAYNENRTPAYYDGTAEDISARKQAEEAVERSEQRLRLFIDHAPVALAMFDREMRYVCASRRWLTNYGLNGDLRGRSHYEVFPDIPERWKEAHRRGLAGEVLREESDRYVRSDGSVRWIRWEVRPWHETGEKIGGIVVFSEDISERKLLESELHQAQKMEAVGRLAGGVAHDFNNLLGVITGYSELLESRKDLAPTAIRQIEQIHVAGKKAAALTQQLLAFSRKQIVQLRILDLNQVVSGLSLMLRRLIGEDIELILRLSPGNVDANQIEQVVMNLAVNARDAMPTGGKLIIETDTCELSESYSMLHRPVRPGSYVRLTITDTGCGMDPKTMSHLFEPFFTTKELGRGTGLGLAIVYGIVKQSQGYVWAYSEPRRGTSFKIYLPLQTAEVQPVSVPSQIENVRGSETVLVVEDDAALRSLVVGFLNELGYSVLEAENGEQALEIASTAGSGVEVVITDIVMPKMGGRELTDRLALKFTKLKTLYTSGYTHDGVVQTRVLREGEAFLQKPFALSELSKKLREVIENGRPHASTAFVEPPAEGQKAASQRASQV
jgi:PAS domain S-box-containing protein